ncbi:putative ribonuclease h protein [Quercus suber]|uniref:Ribonuclease h protein n=1 Tax=Quercus suber TaxID=58331 RepID=A0AAW0IVQ6_QUESU
MLKNPDSLCHRVFKARFFPNCSILEASNSASGSYAWKSILSARSVVRKGVVWRIGDGKTVCIKEDKWLPDQVYKSVTSPLPSIPPDAKVSLLIDEVNGCWKDEEVRQLFLPHEVKQILSIPISSRLPHDSLIWSKTPSGIFSTRSAYRLLANEASASSPSSSNPHPQRHLWRGVWMLRTSNKVKHFIWRACNNSLPTLDNLFRHQIVSSDCCNICNAHPEDILHVVWSCSEVTNMWKELSWAHSSVSPPPGEFTNLFSSFLQVREDYRVEIFSIAAWMLWTRRNSIRLGRPARPLNQIFFEAGRLLRDFLEAHDEDPVPVLNPVPIQAKWTAPTQARYKVNFDAALFNHIDAAGLGIIIRDVNGAVIGALSMRIPLPHSVAIAEALACRRAVQFAAKIGLHEVTIEGDAAVVINAINAGDTEHSSYGHIVGDILAQAAFFSFFEFRYVNRSCNRVADSLAKRAKLSPDLQVWLEDCPQDVATLVLDDVP